MRLFDAHCHLSDRLYENNVEDVITESLSAGVRKMVTCAVSEMDWLKILKLVNDFPDSIIGAIGIHPWEAANANPSFYDDMKHFLKENPFLAIGEIGLDFANTGPSKSLQENIFKIQLQLAQELERPVAIHCIKAWGALFEILDSVGKLPAGGVLHSFCGSLETLEKLRDFGLKPSFSASSLNTNNKKIQPVLESMDVDSLIIETDSPSQPIMELNQEYNRPENLLFVAEAFAKRFGAAVDEIAKVSYQNASSIFEGF